MNAKIIATTSDYYISTKEDFDRLGGLSAGVCYLPDTIEKLFNEPFEKTQKREGMIKASGHHSPFDHMNIMLELDQIPKIIAMYLNNEKMYTTSEKSARYKRMALPETEQKYYDKWLEIFEKEISDRYKAKFPERFTDIKITKLAQENARYLTSVFTPTSMIYTVSYRQLNLLYTMIKEEVKSLEGKSDPFHTRLKAELENLANCFESLGYIDEKLSANIKNRRLSLIDPTQYPILKQFGEVYCTNYKGSYAQLAQAHRHRTIKYSLRLLENPEYFVPPILKSNENLVSDWLSDCNSLSDITPQGTLVDIKERGTFEDFLLKMMERNCSDAQLEIDLQTTATKNEMFDALMKQESPLAKVLKPCLNGSRCTFGYKCSTPCHFADGIRGDREI